MPREEVLLHLFTRVWVFYESHLSENVLVSRCRLIHIYLQHYLLWSRLAIDGDVNPVYDTENPQITRICRAMLLREQG